MGEDSEQRSDDPHDNINPLSRVNADEQTEVNIGDAKPKNDEITSTASDSNNNPSSNEDDLESQVENNLNDSDSSELTEFDSQTNSDAGDISPNHPNPTSDIPAPALVPSSRAAATSSKPSNENVSFGPPLDPSNEVFREVIVPAFRNAIES